MKYEKKYISLRCMTELFYKKAQSLPDSPEVEDVITEQDRNNLRIHAEKTLENAELISNWIEENVSPTNNDPEITRMSGLVVNLFDSAKNLKNKVNDYLNNQNDVNKNTNSIQQNLTSLVQNYNSLRPNYFSEQWLSQNANTDEADAILQIKKSANFIDEFIEKAENAEANKVGPPLPV